MKLAIVVGTRPEILKVAPVIKELEQRQIKHQVYFTSQHFTASMGKSFFEELGIKVSDEFGIAFDVDLCRQWLERKFNEYKPTCVLVHGDTSSALVGMLAAIQAKIPVGHIEAGLRSYDFNEPFPEEYNRVLIDSVATYMFCPTSENLKAVKPKNEDCRKAFLTGNTIIDLIKSYNIEVKPKKQILITMHRRENWERMERICKALSDLSKKFKDREFIFVKHANKKLATQIKSYLEGSNVLLINPQKHRDFVELMAESELIISDSGGIIEEASYLGVPVISVREKTERLEAFILGNGILSGTDTKSIVRIVTYLLNSPQIYESITEARCPFGAGNSAKKIVDILEESETQ